MFPKRGSGEDGRDRRSGDFVWHVSSWRHRLQCGEQIRSSLYRNVSGRSVSFPWLPRAYIARPTLRQSGLTPHLAHHPTLRQPPRAKLLRGNASLASKPGLEGSFILGLSVLDELR